jgi:hypothetical protein
LLINLKGCQAERSRSPRTENPQTKSHFQCIKSEVEVLCVGFDSAQPDKPNLKQTKKLFITEQLFKFELVIFLILF